MSPKSKTLRSPETQHIILLTRPRLSAIFQLHTKLTYSLNTSNSAINERPKNLIHNFPKLATIMDSTKDAETSTVATTTSDAEVDTTRFHPTNSPPVFHYFLKLPAEIRNQIYHDVASFPKSGHLNLFSTSKQMRNEGAEVSARHYNFNLFFGPWSCLRRAHPPEAVLGLKATAVIQNVCLMIYLDGSSDLDGSGYDGPFMRRPLDHKLIAYLGGSEVMRESCRIYLYYGYDGYLSKDCASTTLFKILQSMTSFRSVTVTIQYLEDRRIDHFPMIRRIRNVGLYPQRMKTALEPALGPATSMVDKLSRELPALLFHPFEWKSSIDQQTDLARGVLEED